MKRGRIVDRELTKKVSSYTISIGTPFIDHSPIVLRSIVRTNRTAVLVSAVVARNGLKNDLFGRSATSFGGPQSRRHSDDAQTAHPNPN